MNHSEFTTYFKKLNREIAHKGKVRKDTEVANQLKVLNNFLENRLADSQHLKGIPLYAQYITLMQHN
jgi:replicative DNA helicase